uniref:uncharacterized protein n=1 Tax=Myxine glutinosa TaxID=7769 RepID=UPI00358F63E6
MEKLYKHKHRSTVLVLLLLAIPLPCPAIPSTIRSSLHQVSNGPSFFTGVFSLFANTAHLPEAADSVTLTVACRYNNPHPIYPVALVSSSQPAGQQVEGYLVQEGKAILIGKQDTHLDEQVYTVTRPLEVRKGDTLLVRCRFSDSSTHGAQGKESCRLRIVYVTNARNVRRFQHCSTPHVRRPSSFQPAPQRFFQAYNRLPAQTHPNIMFQELIEPLLWESRLSPAQEPILRLLLSQPMVRPLTQTNERDLLDQLLREMVKLKASVNVENTLSDLGSPPADRILDSNEEEVEEEEMLFSNIKQPASPYQVSTAVLSTSPLPVVMFSPTPDLPGISEAQRDTASRERLGAGVAMTIGFVVVFLTLFSLGLAALLVRMRRKNMEQGVTNDWAQAHGVPAKSLVSKFKERWGGLRGLRPQGEGYAKLDTGESAGIAENEIEKTQGGAD